MRVLHIGLSCFPGGIESFAKNYESELSKHGIVFDFVDIYGDGIAFSDEFILRGSRIFTLPNYKKNPLTARKKLIEIVRNYQNVHIHLLSAAGMFPVKVCEQAKVIPVVHSHNTGTVGILRNTLHNINVNTLRKTASIKTACSNEAGVWMWGDSDFQVIPNAINVEKFRFNQKTREQIRNENGCSEKTLVVGFVGRISEQKNPLFAVDVFEELRKKHPDSELWMIGNGNLFDKLKSAVKERNLNQLVKLMGRRDDVPQMMQAMDVLIFPSAFEGFGIAAIEAQASGLPVVESDTISKETRITDSCKILSLSDSKLLWAEALLDSAHNSNRLIGANLVKSAGYDISTAAERLKNIYYGILKKEI